MSTQRPTEVSKVLLYTSKDDLRQYTDECATHQCAESDKSFCKLTSGIPKCECISGYEKRISEIENGSHFECIDINECVRKTNECKDEEECFNSNGSYRCTCKPG